MQSTSSHGLRGLDRLIEAVQRNCDISDARFAQDLTLCTYLLEMRELYCWEHELPLTALPRKQDLGPWLTQREMRWNDLEEQAFEPVPVAGREYDPFDADGINAELVSRGLVYGGGYGRFRRPQFFLGELVQREEREGLLVLVSGCEYARGLSAPPAALQGGAVYLRQEALRRWLWEKVELWGPKRPAGALASALECYGFDDDPEAALERMTGGETESIVLHEIGESRADALLGPAWKDMIASFRGRRAEILARAVRDNLADCLVTLPVLLRRSAGCSLHFWFANLEGMRRHLFPGAVEAYARWRDSGDPSAIAAAANAGAGHWRSAGRRLLDLYLQDPGACEPAIEALIEGDPPPLAAPDAAARPDA